MVSRSFGNSFVLLCIVRFGWGRRHACFVGIWLMWERRVKGSVTIASVVFFMVFIYIVFTYDGTCVSVRCERGVIGFSDVSHVRIERPGFSEAVHDSFDSMCV